MDVSYLLKGAVFLVAGLLAACGGGGDDDGGGGTPDTTAPEITLLGANPLNLSVGDTYTDPGATASDNVDGDITSNIVVAGDTVNTVIVGAYVVTYDVSDAAGNPATRLTRTVNVTDTVPPVITLLGTNPLKISVGDTYTDPGATASDNVDGDVTGNIVAAGDSVDTANVGTYVVTYDVSDAAGNPAIQLTRTVNVSVAGTDTVPPVITLLGANPLDLSVGDIYTDPGATALDNIDGDITGNIVVAGATVDTATVGTYVMTYDVSDAAGNPAVQLTRTVNVGDDTPPVITLLGTNPLDLSVGDTYTDPGATASDNVDGDITGNIIVAGATVDTTTVGIYVVTYDVSDAAGNPAVQLTRTVNVGDDTPPVITLLGTNPLNLSVGDTYTDPGATASDNVDGDITGNIVVAGDTVDTAVAGSYVVTYDVSDVAGNPATQVTRTVNVGDDTPPVITLLGENPLNLSVGGTYTDPGATASDNVDGDITGNIVVAGDTVDTAVAGSYVVTYDVSDAAGNAALQLTRTVSVATVIAPLSTDVLVNGPAVASERLLYTITVANATALPIDDVAVSLVVPAELSFVRSWDAEPDATGCTTCGPATEPTWNLGTLAAGESRTITVNALVDAATLNGVIVTLPVVFRSTGVSDVQINKVVEVFNSPSADLALSASTDPVVVNETFTYQLDFGNTSAGSLTTVELRAFLPAGVTVSSISDGGTEVNPGEVVWSEGSLGVGASLHREITVTADAGLTAGQILKAMAQLTHDGGQAIDNTAEYALTVVSSALPLEVDISTSVNPVITDERVLYTITVSNSSLLPVNNVIVQLRVPAELSFVRTWGAEPDATGCSTCGPATEPTWNLGTLAAGESRTITVNALVASVLSGNLITTPVRVTATDLGDTIDLRKTVAVFNAPSADLALNASTDPVVAGETFTYQFDFGNTSAVSLTTVELRAFLPPGVTVSAISDSGTEANPGEIVWDEGSLEIGASLHREITVIADAGLTAGQILKAMAQLTHDGGQAIDNTAEYALTVVSSALPLEVDINTSVNPVITDERVLYTITVSNSSLLPVNNVIVQLRVPAELSFVRTWGAEPDATGCSTCGPATEPTWNLGTLAAGESRTITVNALVASVLSGNLITTPVRVTATDLGDTIDLRKTVAVFNAPSADLALNASKDPVIAGETFTYQLDFGNTSAGSLTTVELRAFLPSGVTVISVSDGGIEVNTGEVVWSEGSLGVGGSLHREITVIADAGLTAGQILKAMAQLTHDGGQAIDNTAEYALTVVSSALPLEVDINTSVNPVITDERVLYTITVSNSSLLPVNNVIVQLRVPAELSFVRTWGAEPDATGCSTCGPATEPTWNLGTLAAGESRTITVNALVASVLSGNLITTPVRVTATDLGDTIDLRKTVAVFNSPSADLALSASADPVVANEIFTYQLDFGNTSAGSLTTVELRAFLPPGVTVSTISDSGTEVSTGEVVWNVATLNAGASVHRGITVVADGATAGDVLTLSAELSHDGGLEIDNRSRFAVSVAKNAGIASLLSVDIAATPQPVASSGILVYTITVTNGYGLPVDDVSVQLRVPAELSFVRTDAEPDATGCSTCGPATEPTWDLGTMAAGANKVITINATVASGIDSGTLISALVRVTATEMQDTINLQHTTAINN